MGLAFRTDDSCQHGASRAFGLLPLTCFRTSEIQPQRTPYMEPRKSLETPPEGTPIPGHSLDSLFEEVYHELRGIARGMLRSSPPNRTLQPTVLVHEAYLRLCRTFPNECANRGHFFAAAAEAMRRILIEDARRRLTLRRGGKWARIPLDKIQVATDAHPEILLGIDEALEKLSADHPLRAQVVKLMFFGGLTAVETGEALNICDRTVKRHWAFSRAWLFSELKEARE
jgi:RNA polymerase sigma factor (TIGR02999 family)